MKKELTLELIEKLKQVCKKFRIEGEFVSVKIFTSGHINSTYCVEFKIEDKNESYVVQNVNTTVFKKIRELSENVVGVTAHIRKKLEANGENPERQVLDFLATDEGDYFFIEGKNCWRIYRFITDSFTTDKVEAPASFEDAGRCFGLFQMQLDDYDISSLSETIEDFHHTPKRFEALEKSIDADAAGRKENVENEIAFALERKDKVGFAIELQQSGKIPVRVTHNDTKINNILFDTNTKNAICVIDLDTVMPGLSLYDFGDAMRTGAAMALEDEKDLSKVGIDLELFAAYTRGYLQSCRRVLTQDEIDNFAKSAWLMTFEVGIRFLKDYLDGDVYFSTAYDDHNLVRAKNQFAMVADIEKKLPQMEEIVRNIVMLR